MDTDKRLEEDPRAAETQPTDNSQSSPEKNPTTEVTADEEEKFHGETDDKPSVADAQRMGG